MPALSYLLGVVESAGRRSISSTVRFNLSSSYAPFVASLVRLPIVDKKLVMENLGEGDGEMKDWGQAYLSGNGAGTGAYSGRLAQPAGRDRPMEKNGDYFLDIAEAAPDTVRLRYGAGGVDSANANR